MKINLIECYKVTAQLCKKHHLLVPFLIILSSIILLQTLMMIESLSSIVQHNFLSNLLVHWTIMHGMFKLENYLWLWSWVLLDGSFTCPTQIIAIAMPIEAPHQTPKYWQWKRQDNPYFYALICSVEDRIVITIQFMGTVVESWSKLEKSYASRTLCI